MTNQMPNEAFIVDDNGTPIGHVNIDQMQTDATLFMYELAVAAGDDAAADAVSQRWLHKTNDPDYFGYLAASTLSLMVRCILGPTLDVCEEAGLHLRAGLKRASDDAARNLGGAQ